MPSSSGAAGAVPALPALNAPLLQEIQRLDFSFVVSDAQAADMPIIFASDRFYEATGYGPSEVIGRNCCFLQGPDTERRKVMEIRDAIREDRCCQVCLLNYRKDGSTFLNQFFLSPIKDEQGIVTHYVGIQTDVSAASSAGLLQTPEKLQEQQAAVVLGTAAGCSVCDIVMQPQEVQQRLEQQQQQQQQHVQPPQDQQQQQQRADAVCDARLEGVAGVIQQEAAAACTIRDAFEQTHPHAECGLPSSLLQSLLKVQQSYVLSDPRLPDCPIVHASPQFLAMTGYSREEVVGRNCRFLQGPGTDASQVSKLREAMAASPPKAVTVTLLNYRKDGAPFWNALHVAPVRDADGVLEYFIGVQLDVTAAGGGGEEGAAAAAADTAAALALEAAEGGLPPAPCKLHLRHKMAHLTTTGAVRVACRSLSGSHGGLRRSIDDQGLPARGYSRSLSSKRSGDSCGSGGGGGGPGLPRPASGGSGSFSAAAAAAGVAAAEEEERGGDDGATSGAAK